MPSLPSLEYLLGCTTKSLQDLELSALNRSQQCIRAVKAEWEEAIDQREMAGVARWLIEHRPYLLEVARRTIEAENGQGVLGFPEKHLQLVLPSAKAKPCGVGTGTSDSTAYPDSRRYWRR